NRIAQLEKELESASSQSQLSTIRTTLQREKELDVLTAKKDAMAQKERALQEMRRDMQRERAEAERRWREEFDSREVEAKRQKEAWQEQLKEANARIRELVKDKTQTVKGARAIINVEPNQQKPGVEDFGISKEQLDKLTFWHTDIAARLNAVVRELGEGPTYNEENVDARDLIDWLRGQFEDKDILNRRLERQVKLKDEIIEGMKYNTENQMEDRLANIKEGMRKEYEQTIEDLKRNHRSGNASPSPFHRLSSALLPSATMVTLQELLSTYPLQFAEFKSTVEDAHRSMLDNIRTQNDAAAANLVSRLTTEKEHMMAKHRLEMTDLRRKYQRAFEKSVRKCLEDPKRLESEALRLAQRDKDEAVAKVEERWQDELQRMEVVWREEMMKLKRKTLTDGDQSHADSVINNMSDCEKHVKALIIAFTEAEEQFRQRTADEKKKGGTDRPQQLNPYAEVERLRTHYIRTMKEMRDKLEQSNIVNAERMEAEWVRKKVELDEQWSRRLEELKARYEEEITKLRQTANAAATALAAVAGTTAISALSSMPEVKSPTQTSAVFFNSRQGPETSKISRKSADHPLSHD
ncbi:hypothetical protein BC936DRAFT_148207, partial [Jimgerdemannia flammicorona]